MNPPAALYHALIRTHHVTSRKKVSHLKKAAQKYSCYVLLRSGGSPGIMYCEGHEDGVKSWVSTVQKLRYKDYQLAARPTALEVEKAGNVSRPSSPGVREVATVKEFSSEMERFGVLEWWRKGMGYTGESM